MMKAILYTDGGASPSESYASWILFNEQLEPLTPIFKVSLPQDTTSNEAEYHAIIQGIQYVQSKGYELIEIRSDSKLIINQITGAWHVRMPNLLPLYHKARQLVGDVRLAHVNSKSNQADPKGKSKYVQDFEVKGLSKTVISASTSSKDSANMHPIDEILKQFSEDYKKASPKAQKKAMALLVEAINILRSKSSDSAKWV
ncbi:TPA: ribonuclease HI family protein [Candidatus Poribacteria bacterium]|nr:ribonuclease HI family protein [Candidatus Poribacteria bacterium]